MDLHTEGKGVPAERKQQIWAALRNKAEDGVTRGALEFFLLRNRPTAG
ncbi:hypothetical protein NKH77_23395 [Streptomyces sp. M19]